jgi:hypothetical protein
LDGGEAEVDDGNGVGRRFTSALRRGRIQDGPTVLVI